MHRHALRGIGHDEAHVGAFAFQRAHLNHAADPKSAARRCFVLRDLARRIEEDEVALERIEDQTDDETNGDQHAGRDREALPARRHARSPSSSRAGSRAASRSARRWRRDARTGSIARHAAVTPYAPQT